MRLTNPCDRLGALQEPGGPGPSAGERLAGKISAPRSGCASGHGLALLQGIRADGIRAQGAAAEIAIAAHGAAIHVDLIGGGRSDLNAGSGDIA